MLLTFSKERYMERILSGVKIHTIRKDPKQRWRVGMTCHMWMHSPRNVSKNPFQFAEAEVEKIYDIKISKAQQLVYLNFDGKNWHPAHDAGIAVDDGFDSRDEFYDWFCEFSGRLIFWKNLRRVER